jgi:glutathione S-transferase
MSAGERDMRSQAAPLRLHRYEFSGHSHRVELCLSLLGITYDRVEVDLLKGAQKSAAFLAKNPLGQVPVVEDGTVVLADSNAILVYLAMRYDSTARWLPRDPVGAAQVQRWLSIAAGELTAGPNAARLALVFGVKLDHEHAKTIAARLFAFLDAHLEGRPFLVGEGPTIADLALYSYTACAPEGAVPLESFRNVRGWLTRIEALPGFVPMPPARHAVALRRRTD